MIQDEQDKCSDIESELSTSSQMLAMRKVNRITNLFQIARLQSTYKNYEAISQNKFKLELPEEKLYR